MRIRKAEAAKNANRVQCAAVMSYLLAFGHTDLYPEQKTHVQGFKSEVDDTQWQICKTTHIIKLFAKREQ